MTELARFGRAVELVAEAAGRVGEGIAREANEGLTKT